ncbi:MAG: BGTF surface domain-containing protein [Haloferacaceae archaeon]
MTTRSRAVVVAVLVLTVGLAGSSSVAGAASSTDPGGRITLNQTNGSVTVSNGTSQVLSGTAAYRTGTELVVRVRATGETQPRFLKTKKAVVTGDGTWAVAFDFSAQSAGDTFTVTVLTENDSASVSADGDVVACGESCADQPPTGTPTPIPEQTPTTTSPPDRAAVALDEAVVLATAGDVAAIDLRLHGTDTATLVVGAADDSDYRLTATITDANDDGEATVFVNTALAGREGPTASSSPNDTLGDQSETNRSSALAPGDYPITVYSGTAADGTPSTVATLVLQESQGSESTATVTPTPGPGGFTGLFTGPTGTFLVSGLFLVAGGGVAFLMVR